MLNEKIQFDDEEIDRSIAEYNLHQWLASVNPRHKRFLILIESEKIIENQIGFCSNILEKNTLQGGIR